MRTHLIYSSSHPACGRGGYAPSTTRRPDEVTCQRCVVTDEFARALTARASHAAAIAWRDQAKADMDERNAPIAAALDSVFESAYKVADRAGYCSTFEEIVGDIEVPAWYEIPQRGEHFAIEVRYGMDEIVATDEDEAYAMIAADVRKYIVL